MDMTAIIDRSVLEELRALGGPGDDFLSEVIGVFAAEAPGQIRNVNEALASRDAAATQRAAHQLKGSALGVGARELAALGAAVELAARAGDLERATSGAAGLDAAFAAARAALTLHLKPMRD
jgi:HPt (histidine-containing phosphotransfer) domain-containing protein